MPEAMEMETEKIYTSSDRKNKILAWICIALCFLIYYSIMSIIAPGKKYRELKSEYGFRQNEKNPVDERIFTDSTYLSILKEKSFLQSRVTLAESDSIYLTVNLHDSIVNLEINGVSVHKADIKRTNISKMLKGEKDYVILLMLSVPLTVNRNFASIEKEPLMIKLAPKDTSEYEPDIIPDTADYEPVNFILETDNGTILCVYQAEKLRAGDGIRLFIFDVKHRVRYAAADFARIITFRVPVYRPFIKLRIPRSDAKIIYRALPVQGQIAVYS
ncbi:MAG: hypothetical protein A2Z69_00165 [Bacteroidetes bacterium RBG_13_44_24]|nr:MAG: hypothetical protein A2Z69_00165 [Bacteroidetes bacterium RBG_13_44_24]